MTLGEYLTMLLEGDAGVSAIAGDRIYSEVLKQRGATPAVVFTVIAGDDDHAMDGPTGVRWLVVQVDAWADSRPLASALGRALRALLSGHTGGAAGFEVQGMFCTGDVWLFEPDAGTADRGLYRESQTYDVATSGVEQ